ncbi:MAG: hypothetical protein ABUL61_07295, partial [Oleiharenicola lentus]
VLLAVLLAISLTLPAQAADKANSVLVHPGETVYARFEVKGKKIKLTGFSKEKDEAAQVVFTIQPDAKKTGLVLKVENRFPRDLTYKLEMRSLSLKQHFVMPTSPVVANKVSFENFPNLVEQVAAFDFRLEK